MSQSLRIYHLEWEGETFFSAQIKILSSESDPRKLCSRGQFAHLRDDHEKNALEIYVIEEIILEINSQLFQKISIDSIESVIRESREAH